MAEVNALHFTHYKIEDHLKQVGYIAFFNNSEQEVVLRLSIITAEMLSWIAIVVGENNIVIDNVGVKQDVWLISI